MGVTRLERKGRKNKTVAKERVKTIKRLRSKLVIMSPNKEESGVIIGDVSEILTQMKAQPAAAASKKEKKASEEEE